MEIVLDIHAWAYLARRAFASYVPKLGTVVFENAFVVQVCDPTWVKFTAMPGAN